MSEGQGAARGPGAMDAARAAWAADDETAMGMRVLADELVQSMGWSRAKIEWARALREASSLPPAELALGMEWKEGVFDSGEVRSCLQCRDCKGILLARRWPQALSLVGLLGDGDDPEGQYLRAASLCATWIVELAASEIQGAPRAENGSESLSLGALDAITRVAEGLVAFGHQIEVGQPEAKALGWIIATRDRWILTPAGRAHGKPIAGLSKPFLRAWIESIALGLVGQAAQNHGSAPRL